MLSTVRVLKGTLKWGPEGGKRSASLGDTPDIDSDWAFSLAADGFVEVLAIFEPPVPVTSPAPLPRAPKGRK